MYSTTAFQFQPISVSFFCLNPIFEFGGRGTSAVNRDAVNQDLLCMLGGKGMAVVDGVCSKSGFYCTNNIIEQQQTLEAHQF